MKKRGFTLIELLAVIVILALIALITTPIVMKVVEDARIGAAERSADNYVRTVQDNILSLMASREGYVADGSYEIQADGSLCPSEGECITIQLSGNKPTGGTAVIQDGQIVKGSTTIVVDGYRALYDQELGTYVASKQLDLVCVPATAETVTTGNIPNRYFANGDEYICEVGPNMNYHFFVIGKTASGEINLIADRNMKEGGVPATSKEDNPAWINVEDYNNNSYPKVNSKCDADSEHTCYNAGPITALNYLDKVVENWTNIPSNPYSIEHQLVYGSWSADYEITLDPDLVNYPKYIVARTSRARLVTVQELADNGCKFIYNETIDGVTTKHNVTSCPLYMVNYLEYKYYNNGKLPQIGTAYPNRTSVAGMRGYWTSSVQSGTTTNGDCAIIAHDNGVIDCEYTVTTQYAGVRPVITLSKNLVG